MLWPSGRLRAGITTGARNTIDAIGAIGLLGILYMYWRSTEYSPFLYRGGFVVLSLATAMLIAALVHPGGEHLEAGRGAPAALDRGALIRHLPVAFPDHRADRLVGGRGVPLGRAALQIAATFAIAAVSWRYLEDPIRHGACTAYGAGTSRASGRNSAAASSHGSAPGSSCSASPGSAWPAQRPRRQPRTSSRRSSRRPSRRKRRRRSPHRTVCRSVAHIGDSTSLGLESPEYLPDPRLRISAQYARVGATTSYLDISGGRSIVERYEDQPNGQEAAESLKARNRNGCWVSALGTNEAANVAAGSTYTYRDRINKMMHTIGNAPVMWVAVKTLVTSGPYAETNMKAWDEALVRACNDYPNMRGLQLARGRQGKLVHPRRHPLHEQRLQPPRARDRRRTARSIPRRRAGRPHQLVELRRDPKLSDAQAEEPPAPRDDDHDRPDRRRRRISGYGSKPGGPSGRAPTPVRLRGSSSGRASPPVRAQFTRPARPREVISIRRSLPVDPGRQAARRSALAEVQDPVVVRGVGVVGVGNALEATARTARPGSEIRCGRHPRRNTGSQRACHGR